MKLDFIIKNFRRFQIDVFGSVQTWQQQYLNGLKIADAIVSVDAEMFGRKAKQPFKLVLSNFAKLHLYTIDSVLDNNAYARDVLKNLSQKNLDFVRFFTYQLKVATKSTIVSFREDISREVQKQLEKDLRGYSCIHTANGKEFCHRFVFKRSISYNELRVHYVLFHYNDKPRGMINTVLSEVFNKLLEKQGSLNIPDYQESIFKTIQKPSTVPTEEYMKEHYSVDIEKYMNDNTHEF